MFAAGVPGAAAAGLAMEHVTEGSWESLPVPLHPRVLGALRELGFPRMTPVQVPRGREEGPAGAGAGGDLHGRAAPCRRRSPTSALLSPSSPPPSRSS